MYTALIFLLLLASGAAAVPHVGWEECRDTKNKSLFRITNVQFTPFPIVVPPFETTLTVVGHVARQAVISEVEFHMSVHRRPSGQRGYMQVDCADHMGCVHNVKCTPLEMALKMDDDFFGLGYIFTALIERMEKENKIVDPIDGPCYFYPMPFSVVRHTFRLPVRARPNAIDEPGVYYIEMNAFDKKTNEQLICLKLMVHIYFYVKPASDQVNGTRPRFGR